MGKRVRLGRVVIYFLLVTGSLAMAYPMAFGLLGSLCDIKDFYARPWFPIPTHLYLDNYRLLFNPTLLAAANVWVWVGNTLVRIVWYVLVISAVCTLAGYAFARLQFRGRETAFMYLLSSMMIPGIVFMIPTYVIMARWPGVGGNDMSGQGGTGLVNTWWPLLITGWVNAYYIFLLRQTFYSIPIDFEEAARVDGAGTLTCLRVVYLPMLKPVLTVLVIFQFVALWNDYQWPLIVSSGNKSIWTVSLGLQRIALLGAQWKGYPPNSGIVDYPFSFTLAVFATLPLIILFTLLQSYFVEGVQGFALKG